jgi:hypothetical protein
MTSNFCSRTAFSFCSTMLLTVYVVSMAMARPAQSQSVQLVGYIDVPMSQYSTDVWGWVDPQSQKEYALVGNNSTGVHIIDVSDPSLPVIVTTIDTIPKFDIKTWGHYMYTVDGNYDFEGVDGAITDISDPLNPVVVGSFRAGHNVFIDDLGYMFVTFPGLEIFDLKHDPTNPISVWSGVVDPTIIFHHSGWVSADGDYLFINDEFAVDPAPDVTVWDISTPSDPVRVAVIGDASASVHNSYRVGDHLFMSYYTAGFKVYDISDPAFPVIAGQYDTSALTGEYIFDGAWGCYPFTPSGHVFINDRKGGFFLFSFDETLVAAQANSAIPFVLHQNHPNPFNPSTTIRYDLSSTVRVTLDVLDVTGRLVANLVDEVQPAGPHHVVWDGVASGGRRVASGIYFYRLRTPEFTQSIKMTLVE